MQKASRPLNREKGENDGSPRNTNDDHKIKGGIGLDSGSKGSPSANAGQLAARSFDEWDITGFPGAELLSEIVRTTDLLFVRNPLFL